MHPDRRWFYFNGFNSAIPDDYSGVAKIASMAACAGRLGYPFRPVSVCYRRAALHLEEILAEARTCAGPVVFSGSSMGGWLARIMQLHLERVRPGLSNTAVALNPAYDLSLHGHLLEGPQVNHVTGEHYVWTREHSAALARLEQAVDYDRPLPFFVYVDQGDEVIPWQGSERRHRAIAEFVAYEGGCHSFDHYREATDDLAVRLGE
jgi:predicted esterase YcpF (UPF0227 family)